VVVGTYLVREEDEGDREEDKWEEECSPESPWRRQLLIARRGTRVRRVRHNNSYERE